MLSLKNEEMKILVIHLSIMRKSIKKGFKKNYGVFGHKEKIKIYDAALEKLSERTEETETDIDIELSEEEKEMIHDFLVWYCQQLDQGTETEENEVLSLLRSVRDKVYHDKQLQELQGM